jgi:hypothetical protein
MLHAIEKFNINVELPDRGKILSEESYQELTLQQNILFTYILPETVISAGMQSIKEGIDLEKAVGNFFKTLKKAKAKELEDIMPFYKKIVIDEESGQEQYVLYISNGKHRFIQVFFIVEGILFNFNAKLRGKHIIHKNLLANYPVTKMMFRIINSITAMQ